MQLLPLERDYKVYTDQYDSTFDIQNVPFNAHPVTILVSALAGGESIPPSVMLAAWGIIEWSKSSTAIQDPSSKKAFQSAVGKIAATSDADNFSAFNNKFFSHAVGYLRGSTAKLHTLESCVKAGVLVGEVSVEVTPETVTLEKVRGSITAKRQFCEGDYVGETMVVPTGDKNFEASINSVNRNKANQDGQAFKPLAPGKLRKLVDGVITSKQVPPTLQPLANQACIARVLGGKLSNSGAPLNLFSAKVFKSSLQELLSLTGNVSSLRDHLTSGLHKQKVYVLEEVPRPTTMLVPLSIPRHPTNQDYRVVGAPFCNFWTLESDPPKPECYRVNPHMFDTDMYWSTSFPPAFVNAVRHDPSLAEAREIQDESLNDLYGKSGVNRPAITNLNSYVLELCELALTTLSDGGKLPNGAPISVVKIPFDLGVKTDFARNLIGMELLGFTAHVTWFMESPWMHFKYKFVDEEVDKRAVEARAEEWLKATLIDLVVGMATEITTFEFPTKLPYRVVYNAKDVATASSEKSQVDAYIKMVQDIAEPAAPKRVAQPTTSNKASRVKMLQSREKKKKPCDADLAKETPMEVTDPMG
jgi:hypothetical protein